MRDTKTVKLSDVSSMYANLVKIDKVDDKIKTLATSQDSVTITELNCPQGFTLLSMSKCMFKKDILRLFKDEKLILKHNPNVALGNYIPFVPLISSTGDTKIIINASYFVTKKEDGIYDIKLPDLEGLMIGAYAVYMTVTNYSKVCSNFGMRKSIIDMYVKIFIQAIRGTALFESQKNLRYLTYILTKYMSKVHFGLDKSGEIALAHAKIVDDIDVGWVRELNLQVKEDMWNTLEGVIEILQMKFISLKGKISIDSLRTNTAILLGAPSVLGIDYVPYIVHMAAGYYTNFGIFKSALIKKELGAECLAVNHNVLTQL